MSGLEKINMLVLDNHTPCDKASTLKTIKYFNKKKQIPTH